MDWDDGKNKEKILARKRRRRELAKTVSFCWNFFWCHQSYGLNSRTGMEILRIESSVICYRMDFVWCYDQAVRTLIDEVRCLIGVKWRSNSWFTRRSDFDRYARRMERIYERWRYEILRQSGRVRRKEIELNTYASLCRRTWTSWCRWRSLKGLKQWSNALWKLQSMCDLKSQDSLYETNLIFKKKIRRTNGTDQKITICVFRHVKTVSRVPASFGCPWPVGRMKSL